MQLLLAIVQAEDADVLVDRLIKKGIRVTRLNSLGSFLAARQRHHLDGRGKRPG